MERFCNEQTTAATARTCASLVANIVDTVHIKAVAVQNITHLLSFYCCRDSGLASAVGFCLIIVNEVFAEHGSIDGIFHGLVFRHAVVRKLHGNQHRYAVNLTNADVVMEVLVHNGMAEANEAVAALLEELYCIIERKVDDGAREFQIFNERHAHLALVLRVDLSKLLRVKAHVECCVKFGIVDFSVLHSGQFPVHLRRVRQLIDVAAIKGNNSVVFLYLFLHSNPPFVSYLSYYNINRA